MAGPTPRTFTNAPTTPVPDSDEGLRGRLSFTHQRTIYSDQSAPKLSTVIPPDPPPNAVMISPIQLIEVTLTDGDQGSGVDINGTTVNLTLPGQAKTPAFSGGIVQPPFDGPGSSVTYDEGLQVWILVFDPGAPIPDGQVDVEAITLDLAITF